MPGVGHVRVSLGYAEEAKLLHNKLKAPEMHEAVARVKHEAGRDIS